MHLISFSILFVSRFCPHVQNPTLYKIHFIRFFIFYFYFFNPVGTLGSKINFKLITLTLNFINTFQDVDFSYAIVVKYDNVKFKQLIFIFFIFYILTCI